MIDILTKWTDIMAIKNNSALELFPVLFDVVVLHHDHHHIHLIEELVKIQDLVLDDSLLRKEGIKSLERTSEVAFLDVQHLQGWALTDVIHVFFVGQAIQTHATVVRDVMSLHDLVDALQHEHRLVVVSLHALVDYLGQLGIVAYEEPRIHADAMAAYARTGL